MSRTREEWKRDYEKNPTLLFDETVLIYSANEFCVGHFVGFDRSNKTYIVQVTYPKSFAIVPYREGSRVPPRPTSKGSTAKELHAPVSELVEGATLYEKGRTDRVKATAQFLLLTDPESFQEEIRQIATSQGQMPTPDTTPGDDVSTEDGGSNAGNKPDTTPLPNPNPAPVPIPDKEDEPPVDEKDANQDGFVSAKEEKQWRKKQQK